jgi:hypothetical protein
MSRRPSRSSPDVSRTVNGRRFPSWLVRENPPISYSPAIAQNGHRGIDTQKIVKPNLLAPTRALRRALHWMAGLSSLIPPVPLGAVTRLLRLGLRSLLLMRCVRMILGLEVLGLVWRTFAISRHEFSKFRKPFLNREPTSNVIVDLVRLLLLLRAVRAQSWFCHAP